MPNYIRDLFLYVPEPVLRNLCKEHGIKTSGLKKLQLAEQLVKGIETQEYESILDQHRYAGRGSVVWFRPTRNGDTFTISDTELRNHIRNYCNGDPFENDLTPELDRHPKIISSRFLHNDKIIILMAHIELWPRIVGFEVQETEETVFSRLIIRQGSLFFEARASQYKAVLMAEDIAAALDCTDIGQITLGDDGMNTLIDRLGASTIAAKHKHNSGDYDTTEVVVNPQIGDLRDSSQYSNELSGLEGRRKRVSFDCTFGSEVVAVRAELYPRTGNIVFRSYVDERVLDYVFETVRQIKGL